MNNISSLDRFARAAVGLVIIEGGYFWLADTFAWIAITLGIVLFLTAAIGFCPLYKLIGLHSSIENKDGTRPVFSLLATTILLAIAVGGSYGSIFLTRKLFLEQFNAMNEYYKQALYLSGKGERASAIANFDKLVPAFDTFSNNYTTYRPYNLKGDTQLPGDFDTVKSILASVDPVIRSGDLHQVHLTLEKIRPVFQSIFKRNGFSMLAVALVDFHDAMELMLEKATAKDTAGIISLYEPVSDKLKTIESEANDQEIQDIRAALNNLLASAKSNELESLPSKGDLLKSSFVKVYLKRG